MASENELIVSVSGIRGIVGRGLTTDAVIAFAQALAVHTDGGRIVVSRDGRPSGVELHRSLVKALLAAGCEVADIGIAPTPTCGLAVRQLAAAGGVQITASHNPAQWNGLKLFGSDGRVMPAGQGKKVQELFEAKTSRRNPAQSGRVTEYPAAAQLHQQRVLELVDVTRIRAAGLRTFLDANGGAGGPLGRSLLQALGCRVIAHACEADGVFEHEPEPVAANLDTICPLVAQNRAAIGFVLDPDADRLALIDETGRCIGEELTLALSTLFRLGQLSPEKRGAVVINMSTSRITEDVARRLGASCHRAAVGEANVADMMLQLDAVIGGEGNGGVIDPRIGFVRDPFIGMGLILNLLAETGRRLSELAAELPGYAIVKEKYSVQRDRLARLFDGLQTLWPNASLDRLDGLRLDLPGGWVHVRPSNTEPVVRVIAEAPRQEEAKQLARQVGALIETLS
jgi:phosphomannomutase